MLGGAGRIQRVVDHACQLVEVELRIARQIRDRMAATDVEFGEDHAVPGADVGHRGDHPANRFAVEPGVGDLRTDMTVQADQVEVGVGEHPGNRLGGPPGVECEPELLVADPGGDGAVPVNVDVGRDPDEHPLPLGRQTGEIGDLDARIDHDAADPDAHRGAQLVVGLRVAVHDDPDRLHSCGQRGGQLTGRADVDGQALVARPARHRDGQRRLAGIDDLGAAQRVPVTTGPRPEIGLVEHIGRGAELVGDIGERHLADAQPALLVGVRGERPHRRMEPRRGRVTDGWKDIHQCCCHAFNQRRAASACRCPYESLTAAGPKLTTFGWWCGADHGLASAAT